MGRAGCICGAHPAYTPHTCGTSSGARSAAFSPHRKGFVRGHPPQHTAASSLWHSQSTQGIILLSICFPGANCKGKSPPPHTHTPRSPPPCLSLLCSASQIPSEGLSAGGRGRQAPSFPGFFALEMLETLRATLLRGLKGALGAAGTPRFPQAGLRGRQLRVLSAPAPRPQRSPTAPNGPQRSPTAPYLSATAAAGTGTPRG